MVQVHDTARRWLSFVPPPGEDRLGKSPDDDFIRKKFVKAHKRGLADTEKATGIAPTAAISSNTFAMRQALPQQQAAQRLHPNGARPARHVSGYGPATQPMNGAAQQAHAAAVSAGDADWRSWQSQPPSSPPPGPPPQAAPAPRNGRPRNTPEVQAFLDDRRRDNDQGGGRFGGKRGDQRQQPPHQRGGERAGSGGRGGGNVGAAHRGPSDAHFGSSWLHGGVPGPSQGAAPPPAGPAHDSMPGADGVMGSFWLADAVPRAPEGMLAAPGSDSSSAQSGRAARSRHAQTAGAHSGRRARGGRGHNGGGRGRGSAAPHGVGEGSDTHSTVTSSSTATSLLVCPDLALPQCGLAVQADSHLCVDLTGVRGRGGVASASMGSGAWQAPRLHARAPAWPGQSVAQKMPVAESVEDSEPCTPTQAGAEQSGAEQHFTAAAAPKAEASPTEALLAAADDFDACDPAAMRGFAAPSAADAALDAALERLSMTPPPNVRQQRAPRDLQQSSDGGEGSGLQPAGGAEEARGSAREGRENAAPASQRADAFRALLQGSLQVQRRLFKEYALEPNSAACAGFDVSHCYMVCIAFTLAECIHYCAESHVLENHLQDEAQARGVRAPAPGASASCAHTPSPAPLPPPPGQDAQQRELAMRLLHACLDDEYQKDVQVQDGSEGGGDREQSDSRDGGSAQPTEAWVSANRQRVISKMQVRLCWCQMLV